MHFATGKGEASEDVQKLAAQCILNAINSRIISWNNGGWKADNAVMNAIADRNEKAGYNPVKSKWKLRFAMPQRLYHDLRDQKFDGSPDFDQNPDVMKWLVKQPDMEALKRFPLAATPINKL